MLYTGLPSRGVLPFASQLSGGQGDEADGQLQLGGHDLGGSVARHRRRRGSSAPRRWNRSINGGRSPTGRTGPICYVPAAGDGASTAAEVLAYFRQALLLGLLPGLQRDLLVQLRRSYERDRALFKQYMPLIKKVVAAGWKPVPYATPSDAAIYVERFDDQVGNTFYLTAQNSSTSTKTFQMTVDGASAAARLRARSRSRSSSATPPSPPPAPAPTSSSPTPSPPAKPPSTKSPIGGRRDWRLPPAPTGLPANGSFESGSGFSNGLDAGSEPHGRNVVVGRVHGVPGDAEREARRCGNGGQDQPRREVGDFPARRRQGPYTLSAWTKSSGAGGTYPPTVFVVELDAARERPDRRLREHHSAWISRGQEEPAAGCRKPRRSRRIRAAFRPTSTRVSTRVRNLLAGRRPGEVSQSGRRALREGSAKAGPSLLLGLCPRLYPDPAVGHCPKGQVAIRSVLT